MFVMAGQFDKSINFEIAKVSNVLEEISVLAEVEIYHSCFLYIITITRNN